MPAVSGTSAERQVAIRIPPRLRAALEANTRPVAELRTTADLLHRATQVALYVDGCFWHGCPTHYPERRTSDDRRIRQEVEARGWIVISGWEHEDPMVVAAAFVRAIDASKLRARRRR